ncbi:MAG: extracellular solute-binding protein [Ruminococcus sp.]|nr:extracellular solute-binding protein [Ruminococcus sp.]
MKLAKKLSAAALAVMMAATVSACGDSNSNDTANSEETTTAATEPGKELEESQKEQLASLTEDDQFSVKELSNKTIKWLAHYDINPSNGAVKGPELELFEQKYEGKVEYINADWNSRYTKLASLVMSKESPDFFPADDMDTFPKGAIKAMFQPIDDYVKLDSELWKDSKGYCDQFMFNGKHYIAVIYPEPNLVCIYNTKTIEDNSLDDPAELFENDEWTWDKFQEMCKSFTNPEEEKYGLDGYWYANAISQTSGKPLIGLENGKLVHYLDDPAVAKAQEFMYNLQKDNVCFDRSSNNWSTRGSGDTGEGLGSYLTLFIPTGLWAIQNTPDNVKLIGDVEAGEIMFVPMPRNPSGDGVYYMGSRVHGYNICSGAPNPEGVAAYLDCCQVAYQKASNIGEDVLKNDYKWNDKMLEMRKKCYELCAEHPVFDLQNGVSNELDAAMQDLSQATMITGGGATTWTEAVGSFKAKVQWLLDQSNNNVATEPTK